MLGAVKDVSFSQEVRLYLGWGGFEKPESAEDI